MKDQFKMIKFVFTMSFIVLVFKSQAQTYSTTIKDSEIITSITSIGKTLKINKLNSRISKWTSNQLFGAMASESSLKVVGLIADDSLKTYFTKSDIDFICMQFTALIQTSWLPKDFIPFKIIDSSEVVKVYKTSMHRKKRIKGKNNYFYSLSIPLFSLDRKMVVIKTAYNCGFLCETDCVSLFKISAKGEWVYITQWNCLSD